MIKTGQPSIQRQVARSHCGLSIRNSLLMLAIYGVSEIGQGNVMAQAMNSDRWEWRTFAPSLAQLEAKIGAVANVKPRDSAEIYLLDSDEHLNLKVRDGVVDLKVLQQTDVNGLELWAPAEKLEFPAGASDIARLLVRFRLAPPVEETETLGDFLRWILGVGHFRAVNVHKSRRNFVYDGCAAEFSEVRVNGQTLHSFCIEHADPERVSAVLRRLGLSAAANVSYPRGLKSHFGQLPVQPPAVVPSNAEIERKFLVDVARWRPKDEGTAFRQGYLSLAKERIVRVRTAGDKAFLTIKGLTVGATRAEFEYPIPPADASALLDRLCERPLIEKTRHEEQIGGNLWEIDVFHGENEGLVVAEVELASEAQIFAKPDWAIREVSDDPRYYNNNLLKHPYRIWSS
jgi:adenylate cyclase